MTLQAYLTLAAMLFCIGLFGVITRRNTIGILLGIELMLNAVNINLVAFARFLGDVSGMVFTVFTICITVAEVALGLALVAVAGAELFTGNNLIVMAWASRRVSTARLARNWVIVFVGNLVGALGTAGLMVATRQYTFADGAVGRTALAIAATKSDLGFGQAVALGILCNALVCLAVWLTYGAHTTADKILAIVPPIAAFVAAGFEHSVANMYFIPLGLLVKRDERFVAGLADGPDLAALDWGGVLLGNLLPVTIGNVIGGAVLVGAMYWLVYLRPRPQAST